MTLNAKINFTIIKVLDYKKLIFIQKLVSNEKAFQNIKNINFTTKKEIFKIKLRHISFHLIF